MSGIRTIAFSRRDLISEDMERALRLSFLSLGFTLATAGLMGLISGFEEKRRPIQNGLTLCFGMNTLLLLYDIKFSIKHDQLLCK